MYLFLLGAVEKGLFSLLLCLLCSCVRTVDGVGGTHSPALLNSLHMLIAEHRGFCRIFFTRCFAFCKYHFPLFILI